MGYKVDFGRRVLRGLQIRGRILVKSGDVYKGAGGKVSIVAVWPPEKRLASLQEAP